MCYNALFVANSEGVMNIRNWWDTLQERERQMLSIGGVIGGILFVYAVLWSPLSNAVDDQKIQVQSQQQLLQYIHRAQVTISQYKAMGITIENASNSDGLLSLVEQTAAAAQLSDALKQVQQTANNQLTLTFENVSFDLLMQWLQTLSTTHGVSVSEISATRLPTSGVANVKMILTM